MRVATVWTPCVVARGALPLPLFPPQFLFPLLFLFLFLFVLLFLLLRSCRCRQSLLGLSLHSMRDPSHGE